MDAELTVPRLLERRAEQAPDRTFLRFADRVWTYGAFTGAVRSAAAGLARLGVAPGDRVVLFLPNSPEFLIAWFALAYLRAVAVPINTAFKSAEIAYPLAHSEPALVLAAGEGELRETMEAALREVPTRCPVSWVGAAGLDLEAGSRVLDPYAATPDDVLCFIYTSGTTGRPKAAMQPQGNYVLTGEGFCRWMGITADDRLMTMLPLFHINAQAYSTMGALAAGASLALIPRFTVSRFWDLARQYRATEINIIGSMLVMLWKQPPSPSDREHEVRALYGGPMPKEIAPAFEERFGVALIEGFGMSECTYGLIQPLHGPRKPGSLGRPRTLPERGIGNEVRVIDEQGRDCPPGVAGELVIRNAVLMRGYYKDPERTAETLHDGWLRTGDLAYRDEDGDFFYVGRKKEIIRRRGENLSPVEVETVLQEHPAIQEVAVIGVPAEFSEDEVVACIVRRPGATLEADELRAWCAPRLAAFKIPADVWFLEALPKTSTQRVKKVELREAFLRARDRARAEGSRGGER